MKVSLRIPAALAAALTIAAACGPGDEYQLSTRELAARFEHPPITYGPYVWWHWMGSNFSKEGIRKDLEAMKESGIAGATIFNICSAVQESHYPIGNNPWPEQTYRSDAYWDAMEYAASTALKLGLKIGLHNSVGYSTAGGPWVSEEKGMQKMVRNHLRVRGGRSLKVTLHVPELPRYEGWGASDRQATFYEDIAVIAVPERDDVSPEMTVDLSGKMDADGTLEWDAPEGFWNIVRIGHAPTMSNPHPLPDELIDRTLESDKMTRESAQFHWDNVLIPLKEHLGRYFGKSFTHILVDSYEAGEQDWGKDFRKVFKDMHGYDPMAAYAVSGLYGSSGTAVKYEQDKNATVSRMFIDNAWVTARDKIHENGLLMYWEPYWGPFDTAESCALPDLPMGEFWTGGDGRIQKVVVDNARKYDKRIVGAEAFTGRPENSHYTEDPEFLKPSADGAFASGANRLFLHHWVHQPFDDRYQPGIGMGWWGTHFGRFQTWFEPGKEFFAYLTRCQMLLQQGEMVECTPDGIHRRSDAADFHFIINQGTEPKSVTVKMDRTESATPELWNPYTAEIVAAQVTQEGDERAVEVELAAGESMFVVFNRGRAGYLRKSVPPKAKASKTREIVGGWDIYFSPKLDEQFCLRDQSPGDMSLSNDDRVKYFSGTATYSNTFTLTKEEVSSSNRVIMDLGELNDIAELSVNGRKVAVLWYPPFRTDITDFVRKGENRVEVAVTTNWANRLIGDERYEADFEWGRDRGESMGRAMKAFPQWFLDGTPRPSKERKCFVIWSYFRENSPLQKAGLEGPVSINILSY